MMRFSENLPNQLLVVTATLKVLCQRADNCKWRNSLVKIYLDRGCAKSQVTHSVASFFSSLSSFSCLQAGLEVWTPWDVTSGPLLCSVLLSTEGEMLGLLVLLLPLVQLLLLLSMKASLALASILSLIKSRDFSPSLFLLRSWSIDSDVELGCN